MDFSESRFFLTQFREARGAALKDAEGFDEILFCLERLGLRLHGSVASLGIYREQLVPFAADSALANEIPEQWPAWHTPFASLYDELVSARNDAMHHGAFARLLTTHAVQLALVLEDIFMGKAATAEPWHPVSFARQLMLSNSYSCLPIYLGARGWVFLAESQVAKYLRSAPTNTERKKRLASTVAAAVDAGGIGLLEAHTIGPDASIQEAVALLDGRPILVADPESPHDLIGILTAFDVL
jgi:hypothetical protein